MADRCMAMFSPQGFCETSMRMAKANKPMHNMNCGGKQCGYPAELRGRGGTSAWLDSLAKLVIEVF